MHKTISIAVVAELCGILMKGTNGKEVRVCCPFCGGGRKSKPTASVNLSKNLFHCFRCNEGYNSLSLYAKLTGTDTKNAYKELSQPHISAA